MISYDHCPNVSTGELSRPIGLPNQSTQILSWHIRLEKA